MPSSSTMLSRTSTRTIGPDCPFAFPDITMTLSPFLSFICICYVLRTTFYLLFSTFFLYYPRRERADALISAFDDFARDGAEHAVCFGLFGLFAGPRDKHDRIFIETHVRAVCATKCLPLAHDDRAVYFLFLGRFARLRGLDGDINPVSDTRVAALGTAEYLEYTADDTARVVRYFNESSVLNHMGSFGLSASSCEEMRETRMKRLRLEMGRVSRITTFSPICAVLPTSWTRNFFESFMYFLYFGCFT